MKPKKFLLDRLPGIRWAPHDIPSTESSSSKPKSRNPFALKSSAPQHGAVRLRKSTLSLTSEPDVEVDARTHAQGQSIFFARLPIELRRMVYEYSEAIPYLYSAHTFSLLHITHLLYLPSSIPQPRLDSIRTLHLRWTIRALPYLRRGPSNRLAYREDTANWEKSWGIIASMQGLRHLQVMLIDPSPQQLWEANWVELEDILLDSVREVKRPHDAVVILPYPSCRTDWDMGDSTVRLRVLDNSLGTGGDED
ncbi:hypothetical protein AA0112_g836 [Alternaria arborescens]|nr:hypothetical protein AA0112_g836 [Alternaria arborescens]